MFHTILLTQRNLKLSSNLTEFADKLKLLHFFQKVFLEISNKITSVKSRSFTFKQQYFYA